ncbi:pitrilysin family protein [Streptomyces sp. NPDC051665]|uniref:M16 family metallopeptidase n=1 Tax=Streptomyces sp. NPDC051665 TaxID=3154647 RepID=UPI00341D6615
MAAPRDTWVTPSVVHVIDDRLKTTSLCLAVAYGSSDDEPGQAGSAHLLEHLIMSTPVDGEVSFCERVERLGGRANAETGLELQLYHAQVIADDADETARLLLRAFREPHLDAATLDNERAVVLQELTAAAADPADVVQDAVLAALFPGHPLGRPVGGDPELVSAVSPDQVRAAHRALLARPAQLVVVGPRVPDCLRDLPRTEATALSAAPAAVAVTGPPAPPEVRWPKDADYCWLCFGARSPAAGSPERPAYTVLAQLLGGSSSSLLYRALRGEHGLSYAFQTWNRPYRESGAWRMLIGTSPDLAEQTVEVVRGLLAGVAADGPAPEDLDAARRQAVMSLVVDAEEPLEFARTIGDRTGAGTRSWDLDAEIATLSAVTAGQVRAAAVAVAAQLLTTVRPEGV